MKKLLFSLVLLCAGCCGGSDTPSVGEHLRVINVENVKSIGRRDIVNATLVFNCRSLQCQTFVYLPDGRKLEAWPDNSGSRLLVQVDWNTAEYLIGKHVYVIK